MLPGQTDQVSMPTWLAYMLKTIVTSVTVGLLAFLVFIVMKYRETLAGKTSIVILYIAITSALLFNLIYTWSAVLLNGQDVLNDQLQIASVFCKYIFVQCVFLTCFDSMY